MADILLTHSYFLKFDAKEFKSMMPYAPLGTLYAAAELRRAGYSVALFDSMLANDESELRRLIELHQPKLVVIYDDDFNYLTKMCLSRMRAAAWTLSRIAKERGCIVIAHGSDPADHVGTYLENGIDYVVIGEGEVALRELSTHLLSHSTNRPTSIAGLAWIEDGQVSRSPRRDVMSDLDVLPMPARDLVDFEAYASIWKKRHGYFSMNIVTTRGCPFHCNWCAKPIYGQVYHSRSPRSVVDEMLMLKKLYSPDHLWFCDDIFGLKPGWVEAFAHEVTNRQASTPFKCLSRADLLLKDDTVRHLARSGSASVWIGAESGSQQILDAMEKGTTVEQIYQATALLKRHGISVGFFLQYGYPGEERSDIEKTLKMVKECKPDEIGISVSYPLPGTKFFDNVKSTMGEKQNWLDSQDLELMYAGNFEPDFYRALHTLTHKKFRVWQGKDLLMSSLSNPLSVNKAAFRRLMASAYHALTLPGVEARFNACAGHKSLSSTTPSH